MPVNITLEWTPNPSTLKYVVDRRIVAHGAVNITSMQAAVERSPLAVKLLNIPGVIAVMLGATFVTVTKGEQGEWDDLNDAVMATLDSHLSGDEPVMNADFVVPTAASGTEAEVKIRAILEDEIRPAVMQDGGDITLDRYENGIAYVHMKGSCAGCPSSTATLKQGIETRLREAIPDLAEVVSL